MGNPPASLQPAGGLSNPQGIPDEKNCLAIEPAYPNPHVAFILPARLAG